MSQADGHLAANLLHFGRLLRGLGFVATPEQATLFNRALLHLPRWERQDVKAAARAIYLDRRERQALFDDAFELFFHSHRLHAEGIDLGRLLQRTPESVSRKIGALANSAQGNPTSESEEPVVEPRFTFSQREVLRHKDFAQLTAEEERELRRLMRRLPFEVRRRKSRRWVSSPRSGTGGRRLDWRRTLKASLRHGGEAAELTWRRRKEKPRPLVVLCDVSGSMEPYSRILLQFLYAVGTQVDRYQAFAFGTRLTRLTRLLADRDVDDALKRAAAAVTDWGGGTRIGEALRRFNFDWGRRVLGQGAVVLLISDGWDRGDTHLLEREVTRLHRSCKRLIWLNPLLGQEGYQPLTRGMAAALPHVDDFLPVHNLASLEQLAGVLGRWV